MSADTLSLSVVIPAYNEGHRLGQTLRECIAYLQLQEYRAEIVVVDDGSRDGTAELARSFSASWPALRVLVQPRNQGKGAALRRGCLAAAGQFVMFMDADHSTRIEEIEQFLPLCRQGYGMVAGVRTFQQGESRLRRILGLGFLMFAHLFVFRKAVVDSQCGFKCFTRDTAQALFSLSRTKGGTIDVEIFYLAHKFELPIYFVPVHWKNAPGSTIRIWRCLMQDPIDMLRIRFRDILGRYDASPGDSA
ncbi:MAG: glycosyltransferase family 2 protein [Candidatus Latescibacteria bacterium]|nr:glycosyltransferase family 2 protein [Candidatus Latescibacterota bacterium]